ncbi:MAG: Crp/Fnr family transcriptional regulator [Lawsonibacter sp.]
MELSNALPFWNQLSSSQQQLLTQSSVQRSVKKDTILHSGSGDCLGLILVRSGQLRAFILSPEGREVTLYRLFERDICLFSASCMMQSIQFDLTIQAERDCDLWIIPPDVYKSLMEKSAQVANYTNQIMATRFSEVMWRIEQILWKSFDKRLAAFLIEEYTLEDSTVLSLTHEKIANHLGSAREVVTRMLRYFQQEGMVQLSRGTIELLDVDRLTHLAQS